MSRLLAWLDRRNFVSVRAGTLYLTLWLTVRVTDWAFAFAYSTKLPGVEAAAIIAAVTAPVCALQGFVFNSYMGGKK